MAAISSATTTTPQRTTELPKKPESNSQIIAVLKVSAIAVSLFASAAAGLGYLAFQAGLSTNLGLLLSAAALYAAYKAVRAVMSPLITYVVENG